MTQKTLEVEVEPIVEHGIALLLEMPEKDANGEKHFRVFTPDDRSEDYVYEHLNDLLRKSDKDFDWAGNELIVQGWLRKTVPVVVDYIPAGPPDGRGGPPINPPEYVTKEHDFEYELRVVFEDLGRAYISAEVF